MNDGFSDLLLVGVIALLLGIGVGLLGSRLFAKGPPHNRRMAQQMDELQNEYTRYQAQVNEHFMETAHRMRRLNDSYRDMYDHLARGATRLSNDEDIQDLLEHQDLKLRLDRQISDSDVEPPRDYAPKSGPQDKGTLAEDFGFDPKPKVESEEKVDKPA